MTAGEHLFVWRFDACVPYQHHAIDLGDGTVVHFTGEDGLGARVNGETSDFQVRRTPLALFVGHGESNAGQTQRGGHPHRVTHANGLSPDEVVSRAIREVGRGNYSVAFRNCEHFATWVCTGVWKSNQVDVFVERSAAITTKTALAIGGRLTSRGLMRGAHPAVIVGDAIQFAVESFGPRLGLHDIRQRKQIGRGASLTTCVVLGAAAGPAGALAAGALWGAGECASIGCRSVVRKLGRRDEPN